MEIVWKVGAKEDNGNSSKLFFPKFFPRSKSFLWKLGGLRRNEDYSKAATNSGDFLANAGKAMQPQGDCSFDAEVQTWKFAY